MISIKKDHLSFFSQGSGDKILNNLQFVDTGSNTLLGYEISPDTTKVGNDDWSKVIVLHNSARTAATYDLAGEWYNGYSNGIYTTNPQIVSGSVNIPAKGTVILFQY